MLNLSRQRIGQVMKDAAREVGIDPVRAHPHAFRHTYGRNCVLRGVPIPVLQKWLGHSSYDRHAALRRTGRGASRMDVAGCDRHQLGGLWMVSIFVRHTWQKLAKPRVRGVCNPPPFVVQEER